MIILKYYKKVIFVLLLLLINLIVFNIFGQNSSLNKKSNLNSGEYSVFFEEINVGKNNKVYRASGLNYNIMLRKNEALLFFMNTTNESSNNLAKKDKPSSTGAFTPVYFRFINASESSSLLGREKTVKKISYYNSSKKEITKDINLYKEIELKNIYSGIDLVFSGNKNEFNYVFYLNSGNDINNVLLEIDGVENLSLDAENNIVFDINNKQIIQSPPKVFIVEDNKQLEYSCNFYIKDKNLIGLILINRFIE